MGFLAGLGRAMTALGQDLSFTKREDEERQRREEAAEVRREQTLADIQSGRDFTVEQGDIRREQELADAAVQREHQLSMVPEPAPVRGVQVTDEFGNIHFRNPREIGDTGLNALPRGAQYGFNPGATEGLGGRGSGGGPGGGPGPNALIERQTAWDEAIADALNQGMTEQDAISRIGPRPTG